METWRSEDMDSDSDVIEIIPVEEYDVQKAKVRASLSWILCKAYQDQVPKDFQDPFYETGEGAWQIKPRLANVLANSDVYCQACRNMFGENASQWQGHWSIIQVLSRKGIYAVGSDSTDVTETVLMQSAPFKIKAHLALIDALMKAFSCEIVTVERVTQCVRRFATFNASSELPSDLEDAVLFWVNKVCVTVQKLQERLKDTVIEGGETSQKVRIVSSKTPRDSINVPIMESLLTDMGDGCSIATLISFYCPNILKLEDVCLRSNVGIADSLYNLRLIKTFCDRHLPFKTCHFSFEDLLYTHQTIRQNLIMMIAEIYYWFEIKPLPIVTGAGITQSGAHVGNGDRPNTAGKLQSSTRVPDLPISQVTKQSFQRLKNDGELRCSSTGDMNKHSPSAPLPHRMPLLHKRQQQGQDSNFGTPTGTQSLSIQDRQVTGPPTQSTVAWPEVSQNPLHGQHLQPPDSDRSGMSGHLLANVSIDSEMNASFSSGSIDLGELEPTPRTGRSEFDLVQNDEESAFNAVGKHQKQKTPFPGKNENSLPSNSSADLRLSGVGNNSGAELRLSGVGTQQSVSFNSDRNESVIQTESDASIHKGVSFEPLIPARLKPAKEKTNNHSKEEERDEKPRRKTPSPPKLKSKTDLDNENDLNDVSGNGHMVPGHMVPADSLTNQHQGQVTNQHQGQVTNEEELAQRRFEAFFVGGSVNESQALLTDRSDVTVAESYVIDKSKTPEAARAAGLPIIDDSALSPRILSPRRLSREGSVASSKSSGEFSDHESHKIHRDHKTRETVFDNNNVNKFNLNTSKPASSPGDFIIQKPVLVNRAPSKDADKQTKGLSTNFAQIRQMKQFGKVDNSGFVYMQHGREGEGQPASLKDTFQSKKAEKKTTFAPLPNHTTWSQSTAGGLTNQDEADGATANGSASQELMKIKMKLEEKRKAIERKKHTQEIQQQKIRQRLGKAAFLHVVSKTKDDESVPTSSSTSESIHPARMTNSDPEIPVVSPARGQAHNAVVQDIPSYNKQNRPFSRDDIQQTIENVRKKWFNDEELVASKVPDQNDIASPEMSRSQSSTHSDRPSTLDDLEQFDTRSRPEEVSRRPVVFDRRSASVERITSLADRGDNSDIVQVQESSPHAIVHARESSPHAIVQARESSPHEVVRNRRSISTDRQDVTTTLPTHNGNQGPPRNISQEQRNTAVKPEPADSPRKVEPNGEKKPETYEEYNSSLDKLNQSLTDLQGEIMKLSLKQRKPEQGKTRSRSGSRSPPQHTEVGSTMSRSMVPENTEPARSRSVQQTHSQNRSASEPRQIQPEPVSDPSVGQYHSSTLPRHPNSFHQNTVPQPHQNTVPQPHQNTVPQGPHPYMVQNQVAGPAGPVYPNQYHPMSGQTGIPPSAQQYGSYIMGPTHPPLMAQVPQPSVTAPFQQSPSHMYPSPVTMFPGQPGYPAQPIVSPHTQPFPSIYPSPPHTHYQQHPMAVHPAGTYTTNVHNQQISYTPTSQPYDPTQYMYQQQPQQTPFSNYSDTNSAVNQTPHNQSIPTGSHSDKQTGYSEQTGEPTPKQTVSQSRNTSIDISETKGIPASDKGGFFVSMDDNSSPRRVKNKPSLSDRKPKAEPNEKVVQDTSAFGSSVIADFAGALEEPQQNQSTREPATGSVKEPVREPSTGNEKEPVRQEVEDKHEVSVGFVIGQDETSLDESTEEEMQKKKEKIEKMRLKRQEEQERKRLKIEQDVARKRELDRQRQEETERRKSEEKARREQIFKQYLEKKDDDEEKPTKREKPKQKSRPKSMFVKAGNGPDLGEGGDGCSSTEDISSRAFNIPAGGNNSAAYFIAPEKPIYRREHSANRLGGRLRGNTSRPSLRQNMRKAVSCNTLPQNGSMSSSADAKSLAFGGLTHRRPPSPDLYGKPRRGNRSNESSDGSAHGSDYSGPKLFVKPSSKSNRHIIINAISHCCLAGSVNTNHKNQVLEEVSRSNAKHFIILFRDTSCGYRGLYGFDPDSEDCVKICGVGPGSISNDQVEKYYKYNSGGKAFSEVKSTKHISVSIDAINLLNCVWKQGNKSAVKGLR